jgi:ketosteroid isomerase-like protein
MADTRNVIEQAYSAFNQRDIDGALALMTPDVSWPRASEGGRVIGKEEIRAYWTRQWGEFDPHVEPLAMTEERSASGCTNSSRACSREMFFRTARLCTYLP